MKKIGFIVLAAMCAAAVPAAAQNNHDRLEFGGLVFNHDLMMARDFATLSRTQNFGTARSMGMGGAFTSLGADMTSLSLNPAGLGMYRRSEFSITPMVGVGQANTSNTDPWNKNSKTQFSFANMGAALSIYENASGLLTSVTLGIGLNRMADFNTRSSFSSESRFDPLGNNGAGLQALSIADMFVQQLQQGEWRPGGDSRPIFPEAGEGTNNPNGRLDYANPYFWPAILGYKGTMVKVTGSGNDRRWERDAIGHNASILRSADVQSRGSINEFDLSFGANINSVFYVGASLGIQSVYKRTDITYGETYGYFNNDGTPKQGYATNAAGDVLDVQLDYANMWQREILDGSGVNFKLGVIARPVAGLRLGVAFHTPTFYSLDRSYRAGVETVLLYNDGTDDSEFSSYESPTQYSDNRNSWDFVSPSRLMFGASYTFGKVAIVSVDYERNWYNGIRVKNVPEGADFGPDDYKMEIKNNFCATNAVRAGVEIKPLPILALRVGGGYTSSMLKDESLFYDMPTATESYYFTVGAGVNLTQSITLDVAYQNLVEKQSQYALFYSYNPQAQRFEAGTDLYNTKLTRHFITMTLGFRF